MNSTLKRYVMWLAIGLAIGGTLSGLSNVPHLSAVSAVSLWTIAVAVGLMLVVNVASRGLYRRRGGWRVQLTYFLRANVNWQELTDAEVVTEWNKLGRPAPVCDPEAGWRNSRTNSILLWFTDSQGMHCEAVANPEPNPRLLWSAGLSLLVGHRHFASFPRSSPIVLYARFAHSFDPMTEEAARTVWVAMGGDELRSPACAARDLYDGDTQFECRDPQGNLFLITRGTQTQFDRWGMVGPIVLVYRDLPTMSEQIAKAASIA